MKKTNTAKRNRIIERCMLGVAGVILCAASLQIALDLRNGVYRQATQQASAMLAPPAVFQGMKAWGL